jgi:DNA-binding PadR family transcriptional regulator
MTAPSTENLLARLLGSGDDDGSSTWATLAATTPQHREAAPPNPTDAANTQLEQMLQKIRGMATPTPNTVPEGDRRKCFFPSEPKSLEEARLTVSEVEALALKLLQLRGDADGRTVAEMIKLPFGIVDQLLRDLKGEQIVVFKGSAPAGDYIYALTDLGRERARRLAAVSTYCGSAPVVLQEYIRSVKRQSLNAQHPNESDLRRAFADLILSPHMLQRLGPAVNSGRGMFLYGAAGNGKTSIAERVTRAFGEFIWIPRALSVDGEIIRLFDPSMHEEVEADSPPGLIDLRHLDKRWVRIRRPTIVVGGELTMDNLEVTPIASTGICEAPVQLKSNCGTLVIDDFGRQKMSTDQLLNRWIVPLEKRYDYLNLPSGKKIQVPFDQLIVFSTNLQPKDLCDDAFLRRIPYKIEVIDPCEKEFRELLTMMADKLGIPFCQATADYLVAEHYHKVNRPFRACQPRDLLTQIVNYCRFRDLPVQMTQENIDLAIENYFAIM